MRVLIAADIFPPQSGGPATYSVMLANALQSDGVEVAIASLNQDSDTSKVSCPVYVAKKGNKLWRYVTYFFSLVRHAGDFDVIYGMGPVNAGLPALLAARLRRKNVVVKVVGDYAWEQGVQRFGAVKDVDEFQNVKPKSLAVKLLKAVESFVVKHVDGVVVPSKYLKGIVVGWGAIDENVHVDYNAVKLEKAEPIDKPDNEKWLVTAARIVPWKGIKLLSKVTGRLQKTYPDVRLKVIGDGPAFDDVKAYVQEHNLTHAVELLGRKSRPETLSYIAAADGFVLNSGYEGLSHVLLEAYSLGPTVFASRKCGNTELVDEDHLFGFDNETELYAKLDGFLAGRLPDQKSIDLETFDFPVMYGHIKKRLEVICGR